MVSLNYACEESLTDYLISVCDPLQTTATYYTGIGDIDKTSAPSVLISCDQGTETYPYSNVFDLTVQIGVYEMAADVSGSTINPTSTNPQLGVLSSNIYNAICDPNMKSKVNLGNSHSFSSQLIQKLDAKHSVRSDALISDYTLRVIGCLSGSLNQSPLPTS
jgi:hypothetical protein